MRSQQEVQKALADGILRIRIHKNGPLPVYVEIAEGIRAVLDRVKAAPGVLLPPERILCERYGVSRMTLRQAFDLLQREGLIRSERGRGTFIAVPRMTKQQQEMRSFSEEMAARGARPASRLLSMRLVEPGCEARRFFELSEGERVYEIARVRLRDGVPLALETAQIPERICPGLDRFRFDTESLYKTLEEHYGIELTYCVEEISAVPAEARQRKLLDLPPSTAILLVKRKTYSSDETPVEFTTAAYRGDLYTAIVRSSRSRREKS